MIAFIFQAIVRALASGCISFGTALLTKCSSQKFMAWAFFEMAETVVKHTATQHDDEWLAKIKETYYKDE